MPDLKIQIRPIVFNYCIVDELKLVYSNQGIVLFIQSVLVIINSETLSISQSQTLSISL